MENISIRLPLELMMINMEHLIRERKRVSQELERLKVGLENLDRAIYQCQKCIGEEKARSNSDGGK